MFDGPLVDLDKVCFENKNKFFSQFSIFSPPRLATNRRLCCHKFIFVSLVTETPTNDINNAETNTGQFYAQHIGDVARKIWLKKAFCWYTFNLVNEPLHKEARPSEDWARATRGLKEKTRPECDIRKIVGTGDRHEICPKFYTAGFSG